MKISFPSVFCFRWTYYEPRATEKRPIDDPLGGGGIGSRERVHPPPKIVHDQGPPPKIIDDPGFQPERGGERKGRGKITLTHRTPRGRWIKVCEMGF